MNKEIRILILEDFPPDAELNKQELRRANLNFISRRVETKNSFLEAIRDFVPDVILSDYNLPQFNGLEALRLVKEFDLDVPFILCTGSLTEEVAVECMKEGAADYLLKTSLKRLPSAVLNALEKSEARRAKDEAIAALRESEEKFRSIVETTSQWVWEMDLSGTLIYNNPAIEQILGYTPEELAEVNFLPFMHAEDLAEIRRLLPEFIAEKRGWTNLVCRWQHKDGSIRWLESSAAPVLGANGELIGYRGTDHDITERKLAEEALRESEYKLRTLLASMNEGLVQVNNDEVIEFVNERFCEMTGYARGELLGKITYDILFDEGNGKFVREANRLRAKGVSSQYELPLRKKDGETLWTIVGGTPIINADGIVTGTMGVFTDITERKRAEEQLLHDAFHDGLTGLANRTLFMEHLRITIERAKSRHSNAYAVLFLDFDRFKIINDSLGHAEGDNLLKLIAGRIKACTRAGDLVARLGGDEFVVLLTELAETGEATLVAERILSFLKAPFELGGRDIFISASIGITLSDSGHAAPEDMLRDADIAMYHAKSGGRAQYRIFSQEMHERASKQLQFETEMRLAFERGDFLLHYQPIIELETNKIIGFESLVRWRQPERGMISPLEFIPVAEETGLIVPLGKWILHESCRQLCQWQQENPAAAALTVSVNLSCKQFSQPDLAEQIADALRETGLDPRYLKLEITESHIMGNCETAVEMMNRLRALGVEISLDDFGTGYSSLSYLHSLPIDYLKIDRSFVNSIGEGTKKGEIVSTIVKLAHNLKVKTVAEGIETAEQLSQLRQLNCQYGQGYFFSKPLESEAASLFIGAGTTNPASVLYPAPTTDFKLIG
jgi:diguanylate cyclase (GGDEF)-like protein/PAS domain S-box-containing protein